jgi:hypothetical protein
MCRLPQWPCEARTCVRVVCFAGSGQVVPWSGNLRGCVGPFTMPVDRGFGVLVCRAAMDAALVPTFCFLVEFLRVLESDFSSNK